MYDSTITLFNFHGTSGRWYPSVIHGVDFGLSESSNSTREGKNNASTVIAIIHSGADKKVETTAGAKSYMGPKAYAVCADPATTFTFAPECDFIYEGEWPDLTPIIESEEDEGLYHQMNRQYDGVHMIQTAEFFGLLPHFEIGGR